MRTNIEIDDALLAEAMAMTGLRTSARWSRRACGCSRGTSGRPMPSICSTHPMEGDLHRERLDEPGGSDRRG